MRTVLNWLWLPAVFVLAVLIAIAIGRIVKSEQRAAAAEAVAAVEPLIVMADRNSDRILTRFVDADAGVICYQGHYKSLSCVRVP